MGFFSFLGRLLFASLFILSAWQMYNDFGDDGGPAAKELAPKLALIQRLLASKFGDGVPLIDVKQVVLGFMLMKGLGGILFVFASSTGAFLLMHYLLFSTPLLYDFYSHGYHEPEFNSLLQEFLQSVALLGALLYFIGMKNLIPRGKQLKKKAPKTKAN